jgi:GMP synthase (glutamine-hydrolysing)
MALNPKGNIFLGGPASVHQPVSPRCDDRILVPGFPSSASARDAADGPGSGGTVARAELREYGKADFEITDPDDALCKGLPITMQAW